MDLQVVDDQNDLSCRIGNECSQKLNKPFRIETTINDLECNLTFRCVAAYPDGILLHGSFTTKKDNSTLCFGFCLNRRVGFLEPGVNQFGALLQCTPNRALWGESLTLQILSNQSIRDFDTELMNNQRFDGGSRPEGERKHHWLR